MMRFQNKCLRAFALALLLSCAACLTGCAHDELVYRPAAVAGLSAGLELQYDLELVRQPFTMLKVSLTLAGGAAGSTQLELSYGWGGIEQPENELTGSGRQTRPDSPLQ